MNIRLCYRIEKEAEYGTDEQGNPCEIYSCAKVPVKSYTIKREKYSNLVEAFKKITANEMNIDEKYVTPITLNEYIDMTEEN